MSYLNKKSEPFNPRDDAIPAGALNNLREGMPRQVRGGRGIDVEQFGDRLLLRAAENNQTFIDSGIYYTRFVIRQELDDYLLCTPFQQPVNPTTHLWVPQGYDKDLGNSAIIFVFVAKPPHLQKSIWNTKTLTVAGDTFTVAFDGVTIGKRTVTDTGGAVQTQQIAMPYVPGDVITARRDVTGLISPDGLDVTWADTNDAGRQWVTTGWTGTPLPNASLFAGPVNSDAVSSASSSVSTWRYENWWKIDQTHYLAGGGNYDIGAVDVIPGLNIYYLPFLSSRGSPISAMFTWLQTTVSGKHFRIGIYSASLSTPYVPVSLLDSHQFTTDASGLKESAASVNFEANKLYWIAFHGEVDLTVASRNFADVWPIFGMGVSSTLSDWTALVGYYQAPGVYGTLPSTPGSVNVLTKQITAALPLMGIVHNGVGTI